LYILINLKLLQNSIDPNEKCKFSAVFNIICVKTQACHPKNSFGQAENDLAKSALNGPKLYTDTYTCNGRKRGKGRGVERVCDTLTTITDRCQHTKILHDILI